METEFKIDSSNYWQQIVLDEIPQGSLITYRCGCVMAKLDRGRAWNYPTFYAVHLCPDKYDCHLKHRQLGLEVWDFYDEFKEVDMEATFGISQVEALAILDKWAKDAAENTRRYLGLIE